MKKLVYELSEFVDSNIISDLLAIELGLNDSNKNYVVKTYNLNGLIYCEIQFNHTNKQGWTNPTDITLINENKIKNKIKSLPKFKGVVLE